VRQFLATYRPLCRTRAGRLAVAHHGLPPFVDGSCRREPDLEATHPTITALCRASRFAPRLRVGDRIIYITKRGRYAQQEDLHWRLTALLRVQVRFESHDAALAWHREKRVALPRNLMVAGNAPLALDRTDGHLSRALRQRMKELTADQIVRLWDAAYAARAREFGVVLACEVIFRNLYTPPVIEKSDWVRWCGRVPGTQNPPEVADEVWQAIAARASGAG